MSTKVETLKGVLERLGTIGGIKASSIISADGIPMVLLIPSGINENTFAAMLASMVGSAETALKSLGSKSFERVIAESSDTRVVAIKAGENAILSIMLDPSSNYGLILLEAKKAADEIAGIISQ